VERTRVGVITGLLLLALLAVAGCGGGGKTASVKLNFWSYDEPGGTFRAAAQRCTQQSDGKYTIDFHALGNDADAQRQALVRRLAAKDSSIDIMSMDVVWTSEFAEAGWVKAWPQDWAARVKQGTLAGPLDTGTYKGRLFAAPANSNTQLLWYRKDLIKGNPPGTWNDLISTAEKLPKAGEIAIQGAQYEGSTVWFNSVLASAGGTILDGPDKVGLPEGPTKEALGIIARFGRSSAAPQTLSTLKEDPSRLLFQSGAAAFQINYPFIYASAQADAPDFVKDIGWAPYPGVKSGTAGEKAPIGGFNWGVGGYTKHPDEAFAAATCMRDEQNQRDFALKGGLPPTLSKLYDDAAFEKQYPFGKLIRDQLAKAAVRPKTPFYADVSRAVYITVSPAAGVSPNADYPKLRDLVSDALESKGLF
jgi:multiple sugar transport system substrate-binding protein